MDVWFEDRAKKAAVFIVENNATLREAEKHLGVSRSTIDRDITIRLIKIDPMLAQQAIAVLIANKEDSRRRANAVRSEKALKKKSV